MRVTVVGGGSTYTPELVEGFGRRARHLGLTELVLQDPDADRLAVVGAMAGRVLARHGVRHLLRLEHELEPAVEGAAAVLVQLRVGGQATRLVDETLPGRFGLVGQETTGAGGFAKALRTVPVVLEVADAVQRLAAPDAWVVDFTNPVGIVTRALLDAGHRAVGLCNVAIGVQRRTAALLGVDPAAVEVGHAGLNHLTWVRSVRVGGVERLPELLADHADALAEQAHAAPHLMRLLQAIPSYYLSYFHDTDAVVAAQRDGAHRAEEVRRIEAELLALYADPHLDVLPPQLEQRGGAWYSEAAAALVTSLLTGDGARHVVDVRNAGPDGAPLLADVPTDAVVEVPARVDRDGPHPEPVPPLPPEQLGLVQAVAAYERLTAAAAVTGDRDLALKALLAHPLVRQWPVAEPLLDAVLDAHAGLLPRFARG